MPAARAADRATRARAVLGAASGTLAPAKCPSHLRRNPERRGPPEPRKASRPAGTTSAWPSGRCSPGLRLPPPTSGAKACVQSSERPPAPHHIPIPRGNPRDLHIGPRGERPICVRSLAAGRATAGWRPCQ
ncbi:MAPK regulated corepressor interacting protein 2 isoform X2 [Onychomys torridus]|uniref:MAPK regulated corepressor interacting protein 2 isoform X2 n=1 Tax=Onychomys torridus TaxID=38674 RepID=UPI00167FA2B1|nr:MAPK regulated corepressor interacting protein 2 isoform X2 [Onychomys torridus]XP_036054223.1 MAPK regulated corepressor interacting protein 2 isoform X2 [Onychomys torridus]